MSGRVSVLITDAEYISALAAVRSLGKAGYRVVAVSRTRLAHSFFSRYCDAHHKVADARRHPRAFLVELEELYKGHGCGVLVPVYIDTIRLLVEAESHPFRTLLPPRESFEIANDKAKLCIWARERGYPVPPFVIWDGGDEPVELCRQSGLTLPLVVKAAVGEGAKEVRYIDDWAELKAKVSELASCGPLLIQKRIRGVGYGVSCLFGRDGRLIARFVHRRLREIPPSGGASVYRESVEWRELAEIGSSMLEKLSWRGLAMVEFKVDDDGNPYLMEINPRFWGSMPLAVASGVDFPRLYVEEVLGMKPEPVLEYRVGVRAHRLLFAGLYVLPRYMVKSKKPLKTLVETFAFWDRRVCDDILSLRDPLPAVARIFYTFAELFRKLGRKLGLVKD